MEKIAKLLMICLTVSSFELSAKQRIGNLICFDLNEGNQLAYEHEQYPYLTNLIAMMSNDLAMMEEGYKIRGDLISNMESTENAEIDYWKDRSKRASIRGAGAGAVVTVILVTIVKILIFVF